MTKIQVMGPRHPEKKIQEHIAEWMKTAGLSFDVFKDPNIWSCDGCGCIFNIIVDETIYLDRYAYAGDTPETDCNCHYTPKWIGYDVGTVCWYSKSYSESPWLCGMTQTSEWNTSVQCSLCPNKAVVFLNIPYSDEIMGSSGPIWSCWDHLGVEPYNEKELYEKYTTSQEKENKITFDQVLSMLNKEPQELATIRESIEIFLSLNEGIK
jgi:hypothetical protein